MAFFFCASTLLDFFFLLIFIVKTYLYDETRRHEVLERQPFLFFYIWHVLMVVEYKRMNDTHIHITHSYQHS